jgi:sugar lactone lactonase YvrE
MNFRGKSVLIIPAMVWLFCSLTGFSQTDIISTYAGPQLPAEGVPAKSQSIDGPSGVAVSASGDLYIVSSKQNRVYRVSPDGILHRIVSAQLISPSAVAVDTAGNLYVAESSRNRIRKITPDGITTTVAGSRFYGFGGDGGPATAARLATPTSVAVDAAGNLYIADKYNYRIRKVTPDGTISTVAGNGSFGSSGDGGPATAARLEVPISVAADAAGNLYVGEQYKIRKVTPGGTISTAGNLPATTYGVSPAGIAVDAAGNMYVADPNNGRILKITPGGAATTVAGAYEAVSLGDGGPATEAHIRPSAVTLDPAGNLYIAEMTSHRVRSVNPGGVINTVAGDGTAGFSGDGGPRTEARFNNPVGMAMDSAGNLYIADMENNRVRKITVEGVVTTVCGNGSAGFSGDGGLATDAQLYSPMGVAVDSAGNLYISDTQNNRVRKVSTTGIITTVAGRKQVLQFSGDGGPATEADVNRPSALALDSAGNLYIAASGRIRKVTTDGIIRTVAGTGQADHDQGDGGPATEFPVSPMGLVLDSAGNLYIATYQYIRRVTPDGMMRIAVGGTLPYTRADGIPIRLGLTSGVTLDSVGNMYTGDNEFIYKITPDGVIRIVAAITRSAAYYPNGFDGDGGPALAARMDTWDITGFAVDAAGNLYISDTGNHRIRKLTPSSSALTLPVGQGGVGSASTIGLPARTLYATNPIFMLTGYAAASTSSSVNPYGTAVLSFTQNEVVVSEFGVPASPPTKSARIFVEYRTGAPAVPGRTDAGLVDVQTGVALANPGSATANITYALRRTDGTVLATGHGTLAAGAHYSKFLRQLNAVAPDFSLPTDFAVSIQFGSLDITSDQPVSVLALRETDNQRKEAIFTTTPIADLTAPMTNTRIHFPQIVDGGGYATTLVLLNTSGAPATGAVKFRDDSGNPMNLVAAGGGGGSIIGYSIPPNGVLRLQTAGSPEIPQRGWAEVVPDNNTSTPVGSGIFGYNPDRILISETGIPSAAATTHALIYVDLSEAHNSGLAIANASAAAGTIILKAFQTDGITPAGTNQASVNLPASGHTSRFVREWIDGLPAQFKGVLDISSTAQFSALTLRSLINDRNEFLMTTFPVADATRPAPAPIVFPQVVDGDGYRSQFILLGSGGPAGVTIKFLDEKGKPLTIGLP